MTAALAADAQRKTFATLQACVALWGGELQQIDGDYGPEFIVSRWGLTRRFADLGALGVWLVDVGAWRPSVHRAGVGV